MSGTLVEHLNITLMTELIKLSTNPRTIMNFQCQVTQHLLCFFTLFPSLVDRDVCPSAKRPARDSVDSGGLIQPVNTLSFGTLVQLPCVEKVSVASIKFCVLLEIIDPAPPLAAICLE